MLHSLLSRLNTSWAKQIRRTRRRIEAATVDEFGVPHFVVDDVLTSSLLNQVNANWPSATAFSPEVPGNFIFQMYRDDYGKMSGRELAFWKEFNEQFWPELIASCASVLSPIMRQVFGDLQKTHFSLDWPLTLAQGSPTYDGLDVHTHFYHCPHWAFTVLLYVDTADKYSSGTALHRLMREDGHDTAETNYVLDELEWRSEAAMNWPERVAQEAPKKLVSYKSNRIFVMLDGPLAFHSVVSGSPRSAEATVSARRRVLRCHAKIHHQPFYDEHSARLGSPEFGAVNFSRIMGANSALTEQDRLFRETTIRDFYRERVRAYAEGWHEYQSGKPGLGHDVFLTQLKERVP